MTIDDCTAVAIGQLQRCGEVNSCWGGERERERASHNTMYIVYIDSIVVYTGLDLHYY